MLSENDLLIKSLQVYGVTKDVKTSDIKNVKLHKSRLYGRGSVVAFDYKNKHYYLIDDYSLGDNPKYAKDILVEINNLLKGQLLKNPKPQSDGAR